MFKQTGFSKLPRKHSSFERELNDSVKIILMNEKSRQPDKPNSMNIPSYFIYSPEMVTIPPLSKIRVKTGIIINITGNYFGRLIPLKGLEFMKDIVMITEIVDCRDKDNELMITFRNNSNDNHVFGEGYPLAEIIFEKTPIVNIEFTNQFQITNFYKQPQTTANLDLENIDNILDNGELKRKETETFKFGNNSFISFNNNNNNSNKLTENMLEDY
jgi:dUTPase